MLLTALSCPQCGGVLPKAARWMLVTCPHCGAKVSANQHVVRRVAFSQAHDRIWSTLAADAAQRQVKIGDRSVRLLAPLSSGESSDVFLGEREGPFVERLTVKVARRSADVHRYDAAGNVLRALQSSKVTSAPFFTTFLPQVVAVGVDHRLHSEGRAVLLLRHPSDYWGSLDRVLTHNTRGIDARHIVWMGSRCLDLLGFVHASGWTHGALSLDHLLVQPQDHGTMFVGWSHASPKGTDASARARDLSMLAWSLRRLVSVTTSSDVSAEPTLRDDVPAPVAELLVRMSEDHAWAMGTDARSLRDALMQAAAQSFGPRKFIVFNPRSAAPFATNHTF